MNSQLKAIILKEVREVFGRKDYLLNILPFLGLAFLLSMYTGQGQNLIMEMNFIAIPAFTMLAGGLPFIREKFGDDKILRRFEAILTTPISLKTVWIGKMASLFLVGYPIVLIIFVALLVFWNILKGVNPLFIVSAPVWVMSLVIVPLIPMIYYGFSSWSLLRFTHPKLMQILLYLGMGIGLLAFMTPDRIIQNMNILQIINTGQLVNWSIVAYSTIGIIAAATLILFLINRLDKEKVTI